MVDVIKLAEELIEAKDWRIRENANIPYSFSNVFFRLAGEALAEYVLKRIYPPEVAKAHVEGDMHIHNLYMGIVPYCMGWDLGLILRKGLSGIGGRLSTRPAKRFRVALHHLVNFVGVIQNEAAGAQSFSGLDSLLAPYVANEKLRYEEVKQAMQEFIYGLNVTCRWGGQSPFTNVTFDWLIPEDLRDQRAFVANQPLDAAYEDFQEEVEAINRAFLEILLEEAEEGRIFTFPIPTYNITRDWDWEAENCDLLFEVAGKLGNPYFTNFINSDLRPSDIRSMCCHLRIDLTELKRNITGGLFSSAMNTGSIGVVTINMPRIGFLSKDEDEFFGRLEGIMLLAKESLEAKRKALNEFLEKGLLPYVKEYLGTFENHFSTIGLVGMNEACLNFLGEGIATEAGKEFAIRVLRFMLEKLQEFQRETKNLYNLEATPAESCCYRLAEMDKRKFPRIITAGKRFPYYTNSTWLPVDYTDNLLWAIRHQEGLQTLYTGGTVFHIFLNEAAPPEACKRIVHRIFENTMLPYLTLTPTFSVCQEHGYLRGKKEECPTCGKKAEIYSRVVGYYRPLNLWNEGKKEEFGSRLGYRLSP